MEVKLCDQIGSYRKRYHLKTSDYIDKAAAGEIKKIAPFYTICNIRAAVKRQEIAKQDGSIIPVEFIKFDENYQRKK